MSIQEGAARRLASDLVADPAFRSQFRSALSDTSLEYPDGQKPPLYDTSRTDPTLRVSADGIGGQFVSSRGFRSWMSRFPSGGPTGVAFRSDPVPVDYRLRTLVTSSDTSAGDLVRPEWWGVMEPGLTRPIRVPGLVTVIPTTSDSIEYAKEVSRVEGTATVAEATALTGTSGTKPEGGLIFDNVTDSVKTFALWLPATRRILADANGLAAYINSYLTNDLQRELEDQMLNGAGAGEDFTGILNAGILTEVAGSGPFYAIRAGITRVETTGRTSPTAIVANPTNVQEWDLAEVNTETNHFLGDPFGRTGPRTLWGLPVISTDVIAEGTALVGDFRKAILWDREQVTISVGTVDQDFIRNIVRVLAELRAGFGVIRPLAFCAVTV